MTKKTTQENEEGEEEEKVMKFFRLVNVFDISQKSEFENYLKEQEIIEEKIYKNAEIDYDQALTFVKANFQDLKIMKQIRKGEPKGSYQPDFQFITLHELSSHTLFHELGHHITVNIIKIAGDVKADYAKNEILAELSCYLLMKRFDETIDYNFNYSKCWSSEMQETFKFGEFEHCFQQIEQYLDKLI